jgi:oligoribonuclease (3'-5' exoribonuclease)
MRLFAPSLAFVDLETTGTTAAQDRITEVGIVRVDADPEGVAPPRVARSGARLSIRVSQSRPPFRR